jgi:hypothetical protein
MNATSPDLTTILVGVLLPAAIIAVSWFGFCFAIARVREVDGKCLRLRTLLHRSLAVSPTEVRQPIAHRSLGPVQVFLIRTRRVSLYPWIVVVTKSEAGEEVADRIRALFGS